MEDMNVDAYRFFISWSRILSNGKPNGGINQEGIDYQWSYWQMDYAELCCKELKDRVKNWITLNEPWTYNIKGYTSEMRGFTTEAMEFRLFQAHSSVSGTPVKIDEATLALGRARVRKVQKSEFQWGVRRR
ncbi:hypothetical protein ACSQ67_021417 [Phaseolus vulgaris]